MANLRARRVSSDTEKSWEGLISKTFFPLDVSLKDPNTFSGSLSCWDLGSISLSKMNCDGAIYKRQKKHFFSDMENSLLITVPFTNTVSFKQDNRKTDCKPGNFLIERGDAPYEFWHTETTELIVLKVATESVRARVGPTERISALSFDGREGIANYFLDTVALTANHVATLKSPSKSAAGKHLLELLCLAVRNDDRVLDSSISPIRAAHLHRAEQFINSNLSDNTLNSQTIAEACNISVRYLQKLFIETDRSITTSIREKRLVRAHEELSDQNCTESVLEISAKWGFSDQSQFNKAYKARFNCTPTDTRKKYSERSALNMKLSS